MEPACHVSLCAVNALELEVHHEGDAATPGTRIVTRVATNYSIYVRTRVYCVSDPCSIDVIRL